MTIEATCSKDHLPLKFVMAELFAESFDAGEVERPLREGDGRTQLER